MASRVPLLAVRPDERYSSYTKTRDHADINGSISTMADTLDARIPAASRLPQKLRLPLVVLSTFTLSSLLYSLVSGITGPELAAVSRNLTSGWHIAAMIVWKIVELTIAWNACYDYVDLAYLTLLNNVPHYFLLNTFYGIDYFATVIPLTIDVATIAIPFALLRRLNRGHDTAGAKTDNQHIAQDASVRVLITIFGASVYSIVVYGSFMTWLPVYIVLHFDGVRSLEKVHSTGLYQMIALFAPLGYAATQFIFVPAIGSKGNPGLTDTSVTRSRAHFNPEKASFTQTVLYNLGFSGTGFTPRAKILAQRTAILAVGCFVNTFVRSYVTIEGTELVGALGWAGVWAAGAGMTGLAYAWVGNE